MTTKVAKNTLCNNNLLLPNIVTVKSDLTSNLGNLGKIFAPLERPNGLSEITTDTLKLRFPLSTVHVKDEILFSKELTVNNLTGEIKHEKISTLHKDKTYYRIEPINLDGKSPTDCVVIALGAKLLKKRYLEGITIDNKDLIYDAIQSHGFIGFSMDTFMDKSTCTDIDYKKDIYYKGDIKKLINGLYAMSRPKKKQGEGCLPFRKKDNLGIQWSKRETTSTRSNPFLKMYAKGIELMRQHPKFHTEYLSEYDLKGLLRLEATLKNKKHFKHLFKHENQTLSAVLGMPQEDKQSVFNHAIKCHLIPKPKLKTKKIKLNGQKVIIYKSMCHILSNGIMTFDEYSEDMLREFETKQERSRKRKMLQDLYDVYIGENDADLYWLDELFWSNLKTA